MAVGLSDLFLFNDNYNKVKLQADMASDEEVCFDGAYLTSYGKKIMEVPIIVKSAPNNRFPINLT